MSCGVGHRWGSNLAWLWLWSRPEAISLIPPLAWEPPHTMGAALKRQTLQKQTKNKKLNAQLPSDLAVTFLAPYPKEVKTVT